MIVWPALLVLFVGVFLVICIWLYWFMNIATYLIGFNHEAGSSSQSACFGAQFTVRSEQQLVTVTYYTVTIMIEYA